jgi:hypothetical protein
MGSLQFYIITISNDDESKNNKNQRTLTLKIIDDGIGGFIEFDKPHPQFIHKHENFQH